MAHQGHPRVDVGVAVRVAVFYDALGDCLPVGGEGDKRLGVIRELDDGEAREAVLPNMVCMVEAILPNAVGMVEAVLPNAVCMVDAVRPNMVGMVDAVRPNMVEAVPPNMVCVLCTHAS